MVDQARRTPTGSIRRKVEDLLRVTPQFVRVPPQTPGAGWWQLSGCSGPPYGGGLGPLVAAAYGVPDVGVVRWMGSRRAPLATDGALVAILTAVFSCAQGSLEVAVLTAVLLQRFPAAAEYADATLDEERRLCIAAPPDERPDLAVIISVEAREVHAQLSPSQRVLLPLLTEPVARQREALNLGRSQTYAAAIRLKALLSKLIPDHALRAGVIEDVRRLCELATVNDRTTDDGSSSSLSAAIQPQDPRGADHDSQR